MKVFGALLLLTLITDIQAIGQISLWTTAASPSVQNVFNDSQSVNIGLRFYTDVPGNITGLRFFKGSGSTGPHTGTLWSGVGLKLAEVKLSAESSSGWQQAIFSQPVRIIPSGIYIVSYYSPNGNYALDENYAWSGLSSSPLHPSGSSPGVYRYDPGISFPTQTFNSSNYWVDPIFVPDIVPLVVVSGLTSFWKIAVTPVITDVTSDSASVTLGLQFYSDVAGSLSGIRFYKGSNNRGPHIATLWSNNGAKLAETVVLSETSSGWQQAAFSPPISILANVGYVVSYLAPAGNYAADPSYPWSSLTSTPLHIADASPGVYSYGSGTTFPRNSYNGSNYWVDPVFSPSGQSGTYSISGIVTGSGATVTLSGLSSQSTRTSNTGSYSFLNLANGLYSVAASEPGYSLTPTSIPANINGASLTGLNFTSTAAPHSVSLTWTYSSSTDVTGYNVYRAVASSGPYVKLTSSPITANSYNDRGVTLGQTYFYAATAVNTAGQESTYSNVGTARIPLI